MWHPRCPPAAEEPQWYRNAVFQVQDWATALGMLYWSVYSFNLKTQRWLTLEYSFAYLKYTASLVLGFDFSSFLCCCNWPLSGRCLSAHAITNDNIQKWITEHTHTIDRNVIILTVQNPTLIKNAYSQVLLFSLEILPLTHNSP